MDFFCSYKLFSSNNLLFYQYNIFFANSQKYGKGTVYSMIIYSPSCYPFCCELRYIVMQC